MFARHRHSRQRIRLLTAAVLLLAGAAAPAPEQIEITASHEGFQPRIVRARRGETLRLTLRSIDGEHCFAIDTLRVEKRVLPGRTTTLDLTPDRVGTHPFHCCLESGRAAEVEKGRLVVGE